MIQKLSSKIFNLPKVILETQPDSKAFKYPPFPSIDGFLHSFSPPLLQKSDSESSAVNFINIIEDEEAYDSEQHGHTIKCSLQKFMKHYYHVTRYEHCCKCAQYESLSSEDTITVDQGYTEKKDKHHLNKSWYKKSKNNKSPKRSKKRRNSDSEKDDIESVTGIQFQALALNDTFDATAVLIEN